MYLLEGVLNIYVFLAIAAGASLMILINIIEAYLLKKRQRGRVNPLQLDDTELINLQGLRSRKRKGKNNNNNKRSKTKF